MSFNWVDLAISVAILSAFFIGIRSSFSRELAKLISLLVAIVAALIGESVAEDFLTRHGVIFREALIPAAFIALVIVIFVPVKMIAVKIFSFSFSKTFDKMIAVVLSFIVVLLWCAAALYALTGLPWHYGQLSVMEASCTGKYLVGIPHLVKEGFSHLCAYTSGMFESISRAAK
jgi:uncharacterized membrane protein required for colicin V production